MVATERRKGRDAPTSGSGSSCMTRMWLVAGGWWGWKEGELESNSDRGAGEGVEAGQVAVDRKLLRFLESVLVPKAFRKEAHRPHRDGR